MSERPKINILEVVKNQVAKVVGTGEKKQQPELPIDRETQKEIDKKFGHLSETGHGISGPHTN